METKGVIKVKTAPATEPVDLTAAKLHLRVGVNDDDTLITRLIKAAREYCENSQRQAYIETTLEYILDEIPAAGDIITLPIGPVASVTSMEIKQRGTTSVTISSAQYDTNETARIIAINSDYAPTYDTSKVPETGAFVITYKAGYGTAASSVPAKNIQAMLLLIGHWYEHREEATDGFEVKQIPVAAERLLKQGRLY